METNNINVDTGGWTTITKKPRKVKPYDKKSLQNKKSSGIGPINSLGYTNKTNQQSTGSSKRFERPPQKLLISKEFSIMLQRARTEKKMTRPKLSQLINEKEAVLADYENGIGMVDLSIIRKLNRLLEIQLPKLKKVNVERVE